MRCLMVRSRRCPVSSCSAFVRFSPSRQQVNLSLRQEPVLRPRGRSAELYDGKPVVGRTRGWGFFAVERAHASTTLSYQRDGAVLERNTGGAFKNYVIPTWSVDLAEIVLPSQN